LLAFVSVFLMIRKIVICDIHLHSHFVTDITIRVDMQLPVYSNHGNNNKH